MKNIIQNEHKVLKIFGIKLLEFNTVETVEGKYEIQKPKDEIITDKDYKILEQYRQKYKDYNNKD